MNADSASMSHRGKLTNQWNKIRSKSLEGVLRKNRSESVFKRQNGAAAADEVLLITDI